MGWSALFLLLIITLVGLSCFFILNLNKEIIMVDLLFFEFELKIGFLILISFLAGTSLAIVLELLYFFRRRGSKGE